MRIYIHASFLEELRQEYCLIFVLGSLGGLRGDVSGVGNPSEDLKDPSADVGNLSASFGSLQQILTCNELGLHMPSLCTATLAVFLVSDLIKCEILSTYHSLFPSMRSYTVGCEQLHAFPSDIHQCII